MVSVLGQPLMLQWHVRARSGRVSSASRPTAHAVQHVEAVQSLLKTLSVLSSVEGAERAQLSHMSPSSTSAHESSPLGPCTHFGSGGNINRAEQHLQVCTGRLLAGG